MKIIPYLLPRNWVNNLCWNPQGSSVETEFGGMHCSWRSGLSGSCPSFPQFPVQQYSKYLSESRVTVLCSSRVIPALFRRRDGVDTDTDYEGNLQILLDRKEQPLEGARNSSFLPTMKARANIKRRQWTPRTSMVTKEKDSRGLLAAHFDHPAASRNGISTYVGPNRQIQVFHRLWSKQTWHIPSLGLLVSDNVEPSFISSIDTRVLFLAYFPDARTSEMFDAISEMLPICLRPSSQHILG